MNKTAKTIIVLVALALLSVCTILIINRDRTIARKYTVVATNFPAYDFARAVTNDIPNTSIRLLIKPGVEIHDYEPTPQDIADIKNCQLFVYNDTEAEPWIERIMEQTGRTRDNSLSMYETATPSLYMAPATLGAEATRSHSSTDEHVWTNLEYAKEIVEKLAQKLGTINGDYSEQYELNAKRYNDQIEYIRFDIKETIETAKRNMIIVGDRFPLKNFVKEFSLDYKAAYDGCEEHSEASAQTVAELIDVVKQQSIPVVFRIELSDGKIADQISRATGAKILEFHSVHNVSQKDFDAGKTYVDLMRTNAKALKEALN